jgi:hypothetical protein
MESSAAAGGQEGRIARSWRLSRVAWDIVRSDRTILVLAVVSTVFAVAGLALVYDVAGFFSGHRNRGGTNFALVTLIFSFPLTFVSVFFNTAIAAAAASVLEGQRLSLREALAVPVRRLGQVALWSLLTSVVGVVIAQVAQRLPLVGNLIVRAVGLSWSVATLFAVPILATEGCSAGDCLRRSARLVKKRWGEGISGNVTITAWAVLAFIPLVVVLGVAFGASRGQADVQITLAAVSAVLFFAVVAVSGVIRETFNMVLYRYALSGTAASGFSQSDLNAPFSNDRTAQHAGRTEERRSPGRSSGWSTIWPWLLSAFVSGLLVLAVEVNKHHYTAHHLSGRIGSAVIVWLAFTTLARFMIWVAQRAARR